MALFVDGCYGKLVKLGDGDNKCVVIQKTSQA